MRLLITARISLFAALLLAWQHSAECDSVFGGTARAGRIKDCTKTWVSVASQDRNIKICLDNKHAVVQKALDQSFCVTKKSDVVCKLDAKNAAVRQKIKSTIKPTKCLETLASGCKPGGSSNWFCDDVEDVLKNKSLGVCVYSTYLGVSNVGKITVLMFKSQDNDAFICKLELDNAITWLEKQLKDDVDPRDCQDVKQDILKAWDTSLEILDLSSDADDDGRIPDETGGKDDLSLFSGKKKTKPKIKLPVPNTAKRKAGQVLRFVEAKYDMAMRGASNKINRLLPEKLSKLKNKRKFYKKFKNEQENTIKESFTIEIPSDGGGLDLEITNMVLVDLGRRRFRRRLLQNDLTADPRVSVEFTATLPDSAAKGRDFQKDVTDAVQKASNTFESSVIPGLGIDKDSIQVSKVERMKYGAEDEDDKEPGNIIMILGTVSLICIVACIAVSVAVNKRSNGMPVKAYNERAYGTGASKAWIRTAQSHPGYSLRGIRSAPGNIARA